MAAPKRARRAVVTTVAALVTIALPLPAQADQIRDMQWHLAFLKADQVHKITKGKGIVVAVVDTGVDATHVDLTGSVLKGKDFTSYEGGDGWKDEVGHGTAMASLIAGHGHGSSGGDGVVGMAPEARILPVRSLAHNNTTGSGDESIRWAVDHGAKVINFSGGGHRLEKAVNYALAHDVVVVAAAGNTREGDDSVIEPANLPGVIAVSGVGKDGKFTDASVGGPEVALSGPGVDMVGADSNTRSKYGIGTGTSGAAAVVSAAAALVRAKYPDLNAASVIERLIATADDKGPKGRDNQYGFGVVDPLEALTATDIPNADRNPLGGPVATPTQAKDQPSISALPVTKRGNATLIVIGATIGSLAILAVVIGIFVARRSRRRPPTHGDLWPPQPPPGAR